METRFGRWLLEELRKRNWSQNELGRRAGLTSGTISNAINGQRVPTPDTLKAISSALKVSKEKVFREAEVLSDLPEENAKTERLLYLFNQLDETDQATIMQMMEFLLSK